MSQVRSNPFSTRFTRPGVLPFLFSPGHDAASCVARLAAHDWRGEIAGPHGSGKSTLLAALRPDLLAAGRHLVEFELHDGQRRLPIDLRSLPNVTACTQFVVDGYEQLGGLAGASLRRFCHHHACGWLVTTHRPTGLPTIYRTAIDSKLALLVVERLLAPNPEIISRHEILARLDQHGGDLRETLFDLYDLFERRRDKS